MKKVAFHTLGCKLNFSETSTIARSFEERGFRKVAFHEAPDVFVINTCSVTDHADRKCRKIVREAKAISPESFVAIIGCYAQLKPEEISEIQGVDAVLGASEKFRIHELLKDFRTQPKVKVYNRAVSEADVFHPSHSINDRTRTFLKVQDGCNYGCAFCTIPLARGKSRSDTIANIRGQVGQLAIQNVKEIVLTGVNTGDFGIQGGKRKETFLALLQELDEIQGIERFRISSIEPNLLESSITDFVSSSRRFVPHFHLPLQSGSDEILAKMNRRYRTDLYLERVQTIRSLMPDAAIGVDVIVGFPGETEGHFLETYEFLKELDVSYLHVFPYSERPNTSAAIMENPVPPFERQKRSKMLRILSEKKRRRFYQQNIGNVRKVLFEQDIADGRMHGFTDNYIRVSCLYDPEFVNEVVNFRMLRMDNDGQIEGYIVPELSASGPADVLPSKVAEVVSA